MKKLAALALIVLPTIAAPTLAEDCKFTVERSARIENGTISRVVIGAGAGDLVIKGEDGRSGVSAQGRACAPTEDLLSQIRLESRREGATVYLKAILPNLPERVFSFGGQPYLDLTVSVPKAATVSVEDSSGDLELSNVRSAVVADSSGDQTLRDIAGDLDVTDSSGDIGIQHIGGNLRLKDSSGDVDVDEVRGNVEVSVDSSGELSIQNIAGGVHVINDSSGDIEIVDVQKDVTIDVDSSGGIRVDRIGGNFTVGADSSGNIRHDRVGGSVRLPQRD